MMQKESIQRYRTLSRSAHTIASECSRQVIKDDPLHLPGKFLGQDEVHSTTAVAQSHVFGRPDIAANTNACDRFPLIKLYLEESYW